MPGKKCIDRNPYDEKEFESFFNEDEEGEVVGTIERGQEELKTFKELFQDVFTGLYKFKPRMVEDEEVQPEYRVNKNILNKAMDSSSWEKLRARTRGSGEVAAMAAVAMGEEVLGGMSEDAKKDANKAIQDLEDARKTLEEGGDENPEVGDYPDELVQAADDAVDQNGADIQAAAKQALDNALDEVEKADAVGRAWGSSPGSLQALPWKQRMALSKRVRESRKLQLISEVIGRFKRIALSKVKERSHDVASQLVGVEMGSDLSLLVPSELANLASPEMEVLFFKNLLEGNLLQYKVEGKQSKGRGPIVCCIDESGSMEGGSEIWAKGVALALATVAHKEKRAWHCIHFSSAGQMSEHSIPVGAGEEEFLRTSIEVAERFYGGGTDFMGPLRLALNRIQDNEELKGGDVVFITDGMAEVDDEFLKQWREDKERLGFSVVGVQIGGGPHESLERFTDNVLPSMLGNEVGDKDAEGVFRLVA